MKWAAPATVETVRYRRGLLPAGAHWAAFGIGLGWAALLAAGVVMVLTHIVGIERHASR